MPHKVAVRLYVGESPTVPVFLELVMKKLCSTCDDYKTLIGKPPCDVCFPAQGYPGWTNKKLQPKLQEDEMYPVTLIEASL